jgi:hypothetical protein
MFCSFDTSIAAYGNYDYDHLAGFQDRISIVGDADCINLRGFYSNPTLSGAGTLTNRYGLEVCDVAGAGIVTNNYGVYVRELTRGSSLDYAIYTAGATPSSFGGTVSTPVLSLPTTTSAVGSILQNGAVIFHTFPGSGSGRNIFIGLVAGNCTLTSSAFNVGIGAECCKSLTTGYSNMCIGTGSGSSITTGYENLCVGTNSGAAITTGIANVYLGSVAGYNTTTGNRNTGIGFQAYRFGNGSDNVCIGYRAGFWETGSSKLFIDNTTRASEVDAREKALIYGVFDSTAVAQDLVVNGQTGVNTTPTAWLTLPAGTATAGTSPLKLTSGTSLTTAEAGAVEFTTDDLYFTITTGAARKGVVLNDGTNLTSGRVPYATTNGRLTNSANLSFDGTNLVVTGDCQADTYHVGATAGVDMASGTPVAVTVTKGIVTAATSVTPVADGTYTVGARLTPGGTDGSITVAGGIITAITQAT